MQPRQFFSEYATKRERRLVGLMSGTSVDGVDAVLVHLSGSGQQTQVEQLAFHTHPIAPSLRQQVLDLSHGAGSAASVSAASVALAEVFADAVQALNPGQIDAIASHGQTISHAPAQSATLQIGNPAVLAQRLGCVVVSDFRSADVAVGGQGAPLVPYADWCLLTHPTKARAIQNIGGIGNVTFLPPNARQEQVLGFDTGPGNMLIDRAASWVTEGECVFDLDGQLALGGEPGYDLLEWLLEHPFLAQKPPKSAGREEFGERFWEKILASQNFGTGLHLDYILNNPSLTDAMMRGNLSFPAQTGISGPDIVSTLTWFTALSIFDSYQRHLPQMPAEVIVGGGGVRNPALMQFLRQKFDSIPVLTHEDLGFDGDAKEALAFCVLANETLLGNPANLPSVTGAARPVRLGSVTFP